MSRGINIPLKYIVYGGEILHRYARKPTYYTPRQVAEQHKVKSSECIFVDDNPVDRNSLKGINSNNFIKLYPKEEKQC